MMRSNSPSSMTISRKRPRIDPHQLASTRTPRASSAYDLTASISSFDAASPSPLVNTDYFLSGGMDTPGAWSEHRLEYMQEHDAARDYRQSRFAQRAPDASFSDSTDLSMSRSMQKVGRREAVASSRKGWTITGAAWALTGGLAGKIFNFCLNTTFGGFQAGGGQAYTNYAEVVTSSPHDLDHVQRKRRHHEVPGNFPLDRNSSHTPMQTAYPSVTPVTHSHQALEDSVTRDNWVFLEHSQICQDEQSLVRKRSRASVAGSGIYDVPQPVQFNKTHYSASFASPRSRTASSTASYVRPHSAAKRPRASLASPSRRQSSLFGQQSPISPEIDTYQRKKRREDKKNDESLRRLNAQLQDMIREGQQALGSKIEIIDDHNRDEGYFDDEIR